MITLNENINAPSLKWQRDENPDNPNFPIWYAYSESVNGNEHLFSVETEFYDEDEPYHSQATVVKVMFDGWDDQCLEITIDGTVDEGKAMCEKLWESIYTVSEYLKVDFSIIRKIAQFQKWPGLR